MSLHAPLRVPVELLAGARYFRLAHEVGEDGLLFGAAVPDVIEGPVQVRFHLPGDPQPIRCRARPGEVVVGEGHEERAERRAVRFLDLDEEGRARIETYVQGRLGLLP
jgi:hypothetical protein